MPASAARDRSSAAALASPVGSQHDSPLTSASEHVSSDTDTTPWEVLAEEVFGGATVGVQTGSEQLSPAKPLWHSQTPRLVSHTPCRLQSPAPGQLRIEQFTPMKPPTHSHSPDV